MTEIKNAVLGSEKKPYIKHDYFSLVSYTGGDNPLPAEKDAATAALGTGFRMPTAAEATTLCNCAKTWESQNGNNGCKFSTGYGSVFLPTAGFCGGTNRGGESTRGCFWTCTPRDDYARNLGFYYNDKVYVGSDARSYVLRLEHCFLIADKSSAIFRRSFFAFPKNFHYLCTKH